MSGPPEPISIDPSKRRRGLFFVGAAVVGVGFAIAIQVGCNDNFVVGELNATGLEKGILEAVRESCGVVALGLLALLAGFAEPLVGAAMVALFGAGLASYYFVPTFGWLLGTSLVWSQGLHVWMPLPDSMTMSLAEPGRVGFRLGQMRAAGAAGFGAGMLAAFLLTSVRVPLRPLFLLAGAVGLLAAAACFGIPRNLKTPGPRLVFRRRYGLYYTLCFLDGWRRQIFLCFAGFLLVRVYGTPVQTILLLYVTVQVVGYLGFPWLGRLIDRVGERRVLVVYFACVTAVFVGYALVKARAVLFGLFLADNILSGCATAITTYVHRLAPPSEHTATLGMGVAMNHVAAVAMPLLGGLLWQSLGYQWVFAAGIVAAVASILVALRVPVRSAAGSA